MDTEIRKECLRPADENWIPPTGEEIKEAIKLSGLSGEQLRKKLGIESSRTMRRWIGQDLVIPYTAWAILCDLAGFGIIWRSNS